MNSTVPITPMWNKLAAGELGRRACMGWAVEHYHWISSMLREVTFNICAKAPEDVSAAELENLREEEDPDEPHMDIVLRFAAANGAIIDEVRAGEGLPTTRSWSAWLRTVCRDQPWHCGVAAVRIGTESQSPRLYSRVLPSLRQQYGYDEEAIKHFWLHSEVDIEHSNRGLRNPRKALRYTSPEGRSHPLRQRKCPHALVLFRRHLSSL